MTATERITKSRAFHALRNSQSNSEDIKYLIEIIAQLEKRIEVIEERLEIAETEVKP